MNKVSKAHFVGIGGIGMSALAHMLLQKGTIVSGSDTNAGSANCKELIEKGVKISSGHQPGNIDPDCNLLVYSSATKSSPELEQLPNKTAKVMHRRELLFELMQGKKSLLVSGAHGKTFTSSLLAWCFISSGKNPSYCLGGKLIDGKVHGSYSDTDVFIAEADESDGSFLHTNPFGAILTNYDADHLDFWKSEDKLKSAYLEFASKVKDKELFFYLADDPFLSEVFDFGKSFGESEKADICLTSYNPSPDGSWFSFSYQNISYPEMFLPSLGKHLVINSLAVCGLCMSLGLSFDEIKQALKSFPGVKRRLEKVGQDHALPRSCIVFDDYAHHPKEIKCVLSTLKMSYPGRKIVGIVEPHRFSRLINHFDDYLKVITLADEVIVTDVFAAGEKVPGSVFGKLGYLAEKATSDNVSYVKGSSLSSALLEKNLEEAVVVFMGAGKSSQYCLEFVGNFS